MEANQLRIYSTQTSQKTTTDLLGVQPMESNHSNDPHRPLGYATYGNQPVKHATHPNHSYWTVNHIIYSHSLILFTGSVTCSIESSCPARHSIYSILFQGSATWSIDSTYLAVYYSLQSSHPLPRPSHPLNWFHIPSWMYHSLPSPYPLLRPDLLHHLLRLPNFMIIQAQMPSIYILLHCSILPW